MSLVVSTSPANSLPLSSRWEGEGDENRAEIQKLKVKKPKQSKLKPFVATRSVLLTQSFQEEAEQLDLSPDIIENSPVLQRWLQQIPNVLEEIRHDPSFVTRWRLGYSQFPSNDQAAGVNLGVEDLFIGRSRFTVSGDYQASFNGDRTSFGANVQYYVLALGNYVNMAPTLGYRYLQSDDYNTDGVNVGVKLIFALSRGGAADISFSQSFVSPGSQNEVGITTLSFGYALTSHLRLATDIQKQNSPAAKDSRVGIVLEWMP